MYLEIITPDKKVYEGEVQSVTFPGTEGSFGILNNHAPIVSTLKSGKIKIVNEQKVKEEFDVKGGVVEVSKNKITVLAQ